MICQIQGCTNQARYIDDTGAMVCGICPLKLGRDSIRIMDVPALLDWARLMQRDYGLGHTKLDHRFSDLNKILGRKP